MSSATTRLLGILNSLGESSQFCSTGSLAPVLPGFEIKDVGAVGVPISASDAKRIIRVASRAPYGLGEETVVDTDVRRVWQLEPEQFSLRNAVWDEFVSGIVQTVRDEFGIHQKVRHELYKLLVYEKGSFFKPHRDTEKTPGMFATLVVCLPSQHTGGTLVVTHDGESRRVDFGGKKSEFNIQYAAFYADCQHEITPVRAGYRVCLVYNLAIVRQKKQPSAPENGPAVGAVAELLPQVFVDESRDKIVIPFVHQYTAAALDPRQLKGADRARMDVLTRAATRLDYQVFVALLTHWQSGTPDYSTMEYLAHRRHRYYDEQEEEDISSQNQDAEFEEVFDESMTLDCWLDAQGRKQPFGEIQLQQEEIVSSDLEGGEYTQEIREATGNEGASMERWYRHAVAVIWPRNRYFRILSREGPSHAVSALEEMIATRTRNDQACGDFAREIIRFWPREEWIPAETRAMTSRMLTILDKLGIAELSSEFAGEILPKQCNGCDGKGLARLAGRFGWEFLSAPLERVIASQLPDSHTAELATATRIFEELCCSKMPMTDERRAVCGRLAQEVEQIIDQWDTGERVKNRHWAEDRDEGGTRKGIVESVFLAFTALEEIDRLGQFVSHVLSKPTCYDPRTVLIPAVKSLHATISPDLASYDSFERLRHHCLTDLQSATATPVKPPNDWTREATIDCECADCRELIRFLRDPMLRVIRFPRRKELRQHLHQQIDTHRCDLTHVTMRVGSPQTLVCEKTDATYKRRLAQFESDLRSRRELESLESPTKRHPQKSRILRSKKVKDVHKSPSPRK